MKKFLLLLSLCTITFAASAQYDALNISLRGHWYNPAQVGEPTYGIKYNGIWGWVDTSDNNAEYAIIGSGKGVHIIDVSDPANPVERDFVLGAKDFCIWREFKTYNNYLYAVSDDGPNNSFQIIDLSYLPDSVHVVHDGTSFFERSHTIFIDGDKLYCGSVTLPASGGFYSMAVYSLANPEVPTLLRTLNQDYPAIGYVHDMFVRNDTVYASCGFDGLYIYKFNTGTNTFSTINTVTTYPDQGYNHSSALTPDGKTLVFCDEVPDDLAVKILDLTDITNIPTAITFKSNEGATPHNPYIYGSDYAVIAYYQDGLQIFNISDPSNPVRTGFFDTDTLKGLNDNYAPTPTYHGNWGAYLDLPSGNFIASDMQNGLFVLDASFAVGIAQHSSESSVSMYPNPATDVANIRLELKTKDQLLFSVYDVSGRLLMQEEAAYNPGAAIHTLDISGLKPGAYLLEVKGRQNNFSSKLLKTQ
jgi:choice-of-anchor B domain-containing protein